MEPVIVVGAGPVGLALALALTRHGVPCVVLDEGSWKDEERLARTAVLRADTANWLEQLTGAALSGPPRAPGPVRADPRGGGPADIARAALPPASPVTQGDVDPAGSRWSGWRLMRRKQTVRHIVFGEGDAAEGAARSRAGELFAAPLHIPQHALAVALRRALIGSPLVTLVADSRVVAVEQDAAGVTVRTRGAGGNWWRGSHVVGCDGPRSTVRKLIGVRFPGRSGLERHAVAALRAELPHPGEALLHRSPPWRGASPEIAARPLPDGVWRLDWLLPAEGDLVTPDALVARVRETLAGWCGGETPPYELLDTGVYTVHHRLARSWRVDRAFLAGDAAHLVGAVGTQGLDEGLRDVRNLAWKLAAAARGEAGAALLDSYQAERLGAVAARLRAADQSLPILRGGGLLRELVPGTARGHESLLSDAHLGDGPLGAPPSYARSPLAPRAPDTAVAVGTAPGAPAADVLAMSEDGTSAPLSARLGRGVFLVLLIAPGTGVWDARHWRTAGIMPRLAAAVDALPCRAELLVAESYPGAAAHTVLLVRPDGHLVTALHGVQPTALYGAAEAAYGGADAPGDGASDPDGAVSGRPEEDDAYGDDPDGAYGAEPGGAYQDEAEPGDGPRGDAESGGAPGDAEAEPAYDSRGGDAEIARGSRGGDVPSRGARPGPAPGPGAADQPPAPRRGESSREGAVSGARGDTETRRLITRPRGE
ncbi:FAD-dependent monooxygenase [Streptomyces sp. NRRL F-5630]|uniref:FAD-dependent monooxygenase n=1 Tax=Streptomyces sp. NRRL F-5630 TaxID=1463864 RepID=UPI003EC01D4C